jgi:rhodanese-related sulfurtransferase
LKTDVAVSILFHNIQLECIGKGFRLSHRMTPGDQNVEQLIEFAGNHGGLFAGFAVVVVLIIWTEVGRLTRGYAEITPLQAVQKINQGQTSIVDISSAADFAKGHLTGAKHIALSRFSNADPDLEKLKSGPVLVVCKNGATAHQAAAKLIKIGAKDVAVLKGGTTQWAADQYPLASK